MILWLDRLEAELGNIRAALEWSLESDIKAQLRLASALLWFWHIRRHQSEGLEWLERGLSIESMERGDQPLISKRTMIRGKALNTAGFLLAMLFESKKASARLGRVWHCSANSEPQANRVRRMHFCAWADYSLRAAASRCWNKAWFCFARSEINSALPNACST
jgi:hypothetical protein